MEHVNELDRVSLVKGTSFYANKITETATTDVDSATDASSTTTTTHTSTFQNELNELLRTSLPTTADMVLGQVSRIITLSFVGNIGVQEMAAAALATSINNVTGCSIAFGFASAVATLTGQAKGRMLDIEAQAAERREEKENQCLSSLSTLLTDNSNGEDEKSSEAAPEILPSTYLFRAIFVHLLFALPVASSWLYGLKPVLIWLKQEEVVSDMAQEFLRILSLQLFFFTVFYTSARWLQVIGMAAISFYGTLVATLFHAPINYLFIYGFGWGYLGAASATVWFSFTQCAVTAFLAIGTAERRKRLREHAGSPRSVGISLRDDVRRAVLSIPGVRQYLSIGLPGFVLMAEWWSTEVSTFLAGMLPNPTVALGAISIFQSIASTYWLIFKGVSVAIAKRVGTALGEQNAEGARFSSFVGLSTAVLLGFASSASLIAIPQEFFPSLYTKNEFVIAAAASTVLFLRVIVFVEGVTACMEGVVVGCGRQYTAMPLVIYAYWVIGLPSAYWFTFCLDAKNGGVSNKLFHNVTGLAAGRTVACSVHMVLFTIMVCFRTDWREQCKKARARLSAENQKSISRCDHEDNEEIMVTDSSENSRKLQAPLLSHAK